ncbi:MAG TPA: hypothetical protein VL738_08670 [Dactylosporangium sp.]|nr:hypothetical protein [Dactylosporangium sp.]
MTLRSDLIAANPDAVQTLGRLCQDLPVVTEPVPSYEDLIWLFETESIYRYTADEREAGYQFDWRKLWPSAVTFRTGRAAYDIEMYIEPRYELVRLRLRTGPEDPELLHLDLHSARTVGVERLRTPGCGGWLRLERVRWLFSGGRSVAVRS